MGASWLERFAQLLRPVGLEVIQAYPAHNAPELETPAAVAQWTALSCADGTAQVRLDVLSPGGLGGGACRDAAFAAAAVLHRAGMDCACGKLEYLSGCRCFSMALTVRTPVSLDGNGWALGRGWSADAGGTAVDYAEGFEAKQDRQRRLLGQIGEDGPDMISPGEGGGWQIRLTRSVPAGMEIPELPPEPFTLTVHTSGQSCRYLGCCWSGQRIQRGRFGTKVEQWGFATGREVLNNGQAEI